MAHKRKIGLLCFIIFAMIAIGLVLVYFIYGSTMIDITDEASINSHLAYDEDDPITILTMESYKDYTFILYTDPFDENDNGCVHHKELKRHPLYKNRYTSVGRGSQLGGNNVTCAKVTYEGADDNIYVIFNAEADYEKVSLFEMDEWMYITRKIDEIEVPKSAYIIFKEYHLESENNEILALDGSVDMDDDIITKNNADAGKQEIIIL